MIEDHASARIIKDSVHPLFNDYQSLSFPMKADKGFTNFSGSFPVKVCQGFIKDHDRGVEDENRCNGNQPFLSTGKGHGRPVKEMFEAELLCCRMYPFVYFLGAQAEAFESEGKFVLNGTVEKLRIGVLKYHAHGRKEIRYCKFAGVLPPDRDGPFEDSFKKMGDKTVEQVPESGLAGAAPSAEKNIVSLSDGEINPLEYEGCSSPGVSVVNV